MSRLTDEQELGKRTEQDRADTPEKREERIRGLIAKYERLGLRERQTGRPTPATAIDAQVLAMIRAGKTVKEIAAHFGKPTKWVYPCRDRAQAREYRQEAA